MRTSDEAGDAASAHDAAAGADRSAVHGSRRASAPRSALHGLASTVRLGLTAAAIVVGLAAAIPWLVDLVWR